MRVLAQTTSAAATESAWSEFDFVFNKRRNALGKDRVNKLVFVHCNARLIRKFQSYLLIIQPKNYTGVTQM